MKYINKYFSSYVSLLIFFVSCLKNSRKALEELRASIFNKFRSSESSKRQQQRMVGLVAALTFNFMVAVGIIFMNKWVRMPKFLYLNQLFVTILVLGILYDYSTFSLFSGT